MGSPLDPQQVQKLEALENDLHEALSAATERQEQVMTRMAATRLVIEQMLLNEAEETSLYVEDTQLEMRAIREVLELEMKSARRDVMRALEDAKKNISQAHAARDKTLSEIATKTQQLHEKRKRREQEHVQELKRIKQEAAEEAARLMEEAHLQETLTTFSTESALSIQPHHPQQQQQPTQVVASGSQSPWHRAMDPLKQANPIWLVISVMCVFVITILAKKLRVYREAADRRQRVLYSQQLKSHFANGAAATAAPPRGPSPPPPPSSLEESPGPSPFSDEKTIPETPTPTAPSTAIVRRPVLRSRTRPPMWSPAASTASTVSSPDTSTAR